MSHAMTWEQICDDPNLRDLPYKIEQDRFGRIVMSPVKPRHGGHQVVIARQLCFLLPDWAIIVECAIGAPERVKAADVAAMPPGRCPAWADISHLPLAPDICVEVLSSSNSPEEMEEKRRLHAERG